MTTSPKIHFAEPRFSRFEDFQDFTFHTHKTEVTDEKYILYICIGGSSSSLTGNSSSSNGGGSSSPSGTSSSGSSSSIMSNSSSSNNVGGSFSSSSIGSGGSGDKGNDITKYKIVTIGNQVWMAENMNYAIEGSKCYGEDGIIYNLETKKCDANMKLSKAEIQVNCDKYGRFYNWEAATKVCPDGWHLPTAADWNTLMKTTNPECKDNRACEGAGPKLRAEEGWNIVNDYIPGTNDYKFSALPGGRGTYHQGPLCFALVGYRGAWWSSSRDERGDNEDGDYICWDTEPHWDDMDPAGCPSSSLNSVRCVKN